jgi:hypothetical protein
MTIVLVLAGAYNLTWGTLVVFWPVWSFRVGGLEVSGHAERPDLWVHLWQCIGMIVGVYGVGYLIAARAPYRHWPIVLVGLLGKLFGPIGAIDGALRGELPRSILWTNLTNDLIWWAPFTLILLGAWRAARRGEPGA